MWSLSKIGDWPFGFGRRWDRPRQIALCEYQISVSLLNFMLDREISENGKARK